MTVDEVRAAVGQRVRYAYRDGDRFAGADVVVKMWTSDAPDVAEVIPVGVPPPGWPVTVAGNSWDAAPRAVPIADLDRIRRPL